MKLVLTLLTALTLAGCGSSDQKALQDWMAEQRNLTRPKVDVLPEPTKFSPQPYTQEGAMDPFSSQKLTQALKRDSAQASANAALIAPELNRRKEPLESYPLDSVTMVGSLIKPPPGRPVALIRVDNLLYQIHVGSYLGQNYGRVTKITETEVNLREIVQDATGEWVERSVTLRLQEGTTK